ncbi:MAG TPA: RidA family protein [Bacteroidia bacterium]|nr:RidA family protein [Bacteroidia bacterium]
MNRINISSGSPWEDVVGYSRAVRIGNVVEVSGTTAVENGAVVGIHDYYLQTKFILEKISKALIETGCGMKDVIRTRIYVCDISKWEDVAKAHAEFFKDIKPAATMVEVSSLIAPELLVEIEVSAIFSEK